MPWPSRCPTAAPRRGRRRCRSPRSRPSRSEAAGQLHRAQRQRAAFCEEAEVVGLQHLARDRGRRASDGTALVDHLHHLVGRDAVGQHAGDEGAGAGADVDVEVVDGAVDGEQVEGAQGADLVDPAGESAAAEHQGGLRRAFAAPASARSRGLDIHNFAHQRGLSQEMRGIRPSLFVLIFALSAAFAWSAPRAPRQRQSCSSLQAPGGPGRRRRQRPVRARRRHRQGRSAGGPPTGGARWPRT